MYKIVQITNDEIIAIGRHALEHALDAVRGKR